MNPLRVWWRGFSTLFVNKESWMNVYNHALLTISKIWKWILFFAFLFWPIAPGIYLIATGYIPNTWSTPLLWLLLPEVVYWTFGVAPYAEGMKTFKN